MFEEACRKLLYFLDSIFCYFLDVYYIVRMLQTENSYLSVGYFGDAHTQSIINYLVAHLKYKIFVKSEDIDLSQDISRCITLEDIDLDELLEQHLTDERKKQIIRHIKVLNREQQARNDTLGRVTFLQKYLSREIKDPLPIWVGEEDE